MGEGRETRSATPEQAEEQEREEPRTLMINDDWLVSELGTLSSAEKRKNAQV